MMDAPAIRLIQQTTIDAEKANRLGTFIPSIVLDKNHEIHSLEEYAERRSRFRGALRTSSLADFVEYVRLLPGGEGFIDADKMAASVIFNLGDVTAPGHGDWNATLALKETAAFSALRAVNGKKLSQRELAEFIEDWPDFFDFASNGLTNLNISSAIAAIRNLRITKATDQSHAVADLSAKRTAMEEIEAKSDVNTVPTRLSFYVSPYEGLTSRHINLRLSVIASDTDAPKLSLRIVAIEKLVEDIAREFRDLLRAQIADAANLTVGTFAIGL